jgi:hypothetical protein
MSVESKIVFNFEGLDRLLQDTKDFNKVVKVGVLGNTRNASILATHEFGSITKRIPRRSVLKDTLIYKKEDLEIKVIQLTIDNLGKKNGLMIALKKLGIFAEKLIQEAFKTGGFGKWAPLSKKTIEKKKSNSILIDTAQLRRGITSKVE